MKYFVEFKSRVKESLLRIILSVKIILQYKMKYFVEFKSRVKEYLGFTQIKSIGKA